MSAWGNAWGTSNNAWVDAWGSTSAVAASSTPAPTGGWESWGGVSAYNARKQRKKDREERLKRLRAEIKGLNRWR